MKIDLTGKVVLLTGSSGGIGRAMTRGLLEAGATVALHTRSRNAETEQWETDCGPQAKLFTADLAHVQECEKLFDEVLTHYGQLDVLINNAGVALETPLESDRWLKDWQLTMDVNLRATAVLCRAALPHFISRKDGIIINVASRAAHRGDTAEYMTYAASKGGVTALSKSIARGYGKDNVRCFVLAPGFVRTRMAEAFIDTYGEDLVTGGLALDRLTEPKDLAPVTVLLASGLADHATGSTIDLNAGSYLR